MLVQVRLGRLPLGIVLLQDILSIQQKFDLVFLNVVYIISLPLHFTTTSTYFGEEFLF